MSAINEKMSNCLGYGLLIRILCQKIAYNLVI